ncbi:MAG TPA: M20/M25/M40 family metallo-hydrolase [Kofleriaceae bacterium]|jgi:glutamate carboxypeptidase
MIEAARAVVRRLMPDLWALLEEWVSIDSYTADHAGCNRMFDSLVAAFRMPEVASYGFDGDGAGRHLVVQTRAAPGTLLVGHHDTVYPPGSFSGFRRDDTRVYGPGVLDMKGGLAVIWCALQALSDIGALEQLPVTVISISDEETGSVDGRRIIEAQAKGATAGLVFEAGRTTDAIVTRRKGTGKLVVTARGKAAHAGNDLANGINAIWALSQFIDRAHALQLEHGATLNVGLVSGGTAANTVPAEARCEIDLRIVRAADGDRLLTELDHVAREVGERTGARFTLEGGIRRQPLERIAGTDAIFARYAAAARAEGLGADEAPLVGGGSDANTLAALGVPAIDALGPRGRFFHTPDEYAEIATFEPRVMALVRYLATPLVTR